MRKSNKTLRGSKLCFNTKVINTNAFNLWANIPLTPNSLFCLFNPPQSEFLSIAVERVKLAVTFPPTI